MILVDPEGLFGGDRLRHCSNLAQLHFPRLFLASNGFARIELNYAKIIGRAYPTFNPVPSEAELQGCVQEYKQNFLLFTYEAGGQIWGQWDTRSEFLPRYKTSLDRRSPNPPESDFAEWKRRYRDERKGFPKCFGNISETFHAPVHAVAVAVAVAEKDKNTCASDDARGCESHSLPPIEDPAFSTLEPDALFQDAPKPKRNTAAELEKQQRAWFEEWWAAYWRKRDRKNAWKTFCNLVRTREQFELVMRATREQSPEMLGKELQFRPYPATWLRGERWQDQSENGRCSALPPATQRIAENLRRIHGQG